MNRIEWTIAGIRIIALWSAAQLLAALPAAFASWGYIPVEGTGIFSPSVGIALQVTGFVTGLAVAIVLWLLSRPLAVFIWRGQPGHTVPSVLSPEDLQAAVFSALGVYLIAAAIPDLTATVVVLNTRVTELGADWGYPSDFVSRTIGMLLQTGVGLALFLHAPWFVRLARRRETEPEGSAPDG